MKILWLVPALLFLHVSLFAQKEPMKFGKVEKEELEITECTFEPDAHAMVLGEFGTLSFIYDNDKGWQYVYEYHKRIKIFDKEAYNQADVAISFHEGRLGNKEVISSLKAVTYNLEGGKVVKTKVENKDEFEEKINENWYVTKFSFPNVKEGSVIEFSYTITSDYMSSLRGWQFQDDLPKVFSEYRVKIPEYFNYQTIFRGNFEGLALNEQTTQSETFNMTYRTGKMISTTGDKYGPAKPEVIRSALNSASKQHRWVVENKPSFKDEPYITTDKDYAMLLEFQLVSVQYPNQQLEIVAGSYDKLAKTMMDSPNFGLALAKEGFLKDEITNLVGDADTDLQKAMNIYESVKRKMRWNGFWGEYAMQPLKKAYETSEGNIADINLLLIVALRNASIPAFPVILSTRNNGKPHPIYPTTERINYVVAYVRIGEDTYLLDAAASDYLPFGELPTRCLNGTGWIISESGAQSINLQSNASSNETVMVDAVLAEDGSLTADLTGSYKDKEALRWRKMEAEDKSKEAFQKNMTDWSISDMSWEGEKTIYEPLKLTIKLENEGDDLADIIYFNPNIYGLEKENPFKSETREFPVDMPYGYSRRYILMLTVPDGYTLDSAPQPMMFRLPNSGGSFQYMVSQTGNKVTVMNSLKIDKNFFNVQEYAALRKFFETVIAKNSEQLVLKKAVAGE